MRDEDPSKVAAELLCAVLALRAQAVNGEERSSDCAVRVHGVVVRH